MAFTFTSPLAHVKTPKNDRAVSRADRARAWASTQSMYPRKGAPRFAAVAGRALREGVGPFCPFSALHAAAPSRRAAAPLRVCCGPQVLWSCCVPGAGLLRGWCGDIVL